MPAPSAVLFFFSLPRTPRSTLFPYTTLFRSLKKEDGRIDWSLTARQIYNRIRGLEPRSEEHTSELQSLRHLVCRPLLDRKKTITNTIRIRRLSTICRPTAWCST